MSVARVEPASPGPQMAARISRKVWREATRPIRQLSRLVAPPETVVNGLATFHPEQATVEPEGISLLERMVRESAQHPGPIIEIGTLLGITTTTLALAKAPTQKIITVDLYCWNPWGITPAAHEALARQNLRYLTQTGQVEAITMDKNRFFETYRGPAPSMVFLDAIHDYPETKKDIQWAQRVGAKIISGHDYCEEFPGVIEVVNEFGGPRELAGTVWRL